MEPVWICTKAHEGMTDRPQQETTTRSRALSAQREKQLSDYETCRPTGDEVVQTTDEGPLEATVTSPYGWYN